MLLDIGYTIGFRLVKDFGSFFFMVMKMTKKVKSVMDFIFFCFFISFPRLMIPLAIVMETADSGGCQNFWHPPLSAYLLNLTSVRCKNYAFGGFRKIRKNKRK